MGISRYRESSRKKRYMGEVLLSIQSIIEKLGKIDETIRDLSTINDRSDADMDLRVIEEDILRAHFDLKLDNFTIRFRVLDIMDQKRGKQPYGTNADRIGEMLDRQEIFAFVTDTSIEGVERVAGNSPDLRELLWIHAYLLEIIGGIERFKEAYEALGPELLELVRATADSLRGIITNCARDKEIQLDLVALGNSEALHSYLFEEFFSIKRLKSEASQVQKMTTTIQDLRKELFRISYLQP